jgi:hypothetical protein
MKLFAWILSLYILVLSLAPNMQGGEYFKVYGLIDHYMNHQTGEKTYSDFLAFLNDHYLNQKHHENEHENLPFKSHSVQTIVIATHTVEIKTVSEYNEISEPREKGFFVDQSGPIARAGTVWNPPQLC